MMNPNWGIFWATVIMVLITVTATVINYFLYKINSSPEIIVYTACYGNTLFVEVKNIGKSVAKNITFSYSDPNDLFEKNLFKYGIPMLEPEGTRRVRWGMYSAIHSQLQNRTITVKATYLKKSMLEDDAFPVILESNSTVEIDSFLNTTPKTNELYQVGKELCGIIQQQNNKIESLNNSLKNLSSSISSPTGIDLSVSSLRTLKHIISGQDFLGEKIDPRDRPAGVFEEVLKVERKIALDLELYFSSENMASKNELNNIEGLTEEMLQLLKKFFVIEEA